MLELSFVRDNLELLKQKMQERGLSDLLGNFEKLDRERRKFLVEAETRKARRNKVSDEIAALKKQKGDASALIAEMKQVAAEIDQLDQKSEEYDARLRELLQNIPNLPHASVPVGKGPEDNQEVRRWGEPRKFDFEPKPHWELGPKLGILDFERATTIAGARFAVYFGRSEEHTSELQSRPHLVCRLLLEKKNKIFQFYNPYSLDEYGSKESHIETRLR